MEYGKNDSHTVQTPGTPASRLDQEMSDILNSQMDDREKYSLYQQALLGFLKVKDETASPIPPSATFLPTEDKRNDDLERHIIESLPKKFRLHGSNLLRHLKNSGKVTWNDHGIISLDGTEVSGANLVDLVNEAMRHRKQPLPRGYEQFARVLRKANIPREFIGNKVLWNTIVNTPLDISNFSHHRSIPSFSDSFASSADNEEKEEDKEEEEESEVDLAKQREEPRKRKRLLPTGDDSMVLDSKKVKIAPAVLRLQKSPQKWIRMSDQEH